MAISFNGFNQLCTTFYGDVESGTCVKISDNSTVSATVLNDVMCGYCVASSDNICTVQLTGVVSIPYSGTIPPAVGYSFITCDSYGGIKNSDAATGKEYLVLNVDTTTRTVTFVL